MRILFLGNNWVAWQIISRLRESNDEIVGLVIHPPNKRKYGEEILHAAEARTEHGPGRTCPVFDATRLGEPSTLKAIKALDADIAVSVLFDYILRQEFLDLFAAGTINLHPSYLPYNRGQYPNVWSIIDGTPAGVTLHYIDTGVDTGDIIAQYRVTVEPVDTGKTFYHKLERKCVELFEETWPMVRLGQAPRIPQDLSEGTSHRRRDADEAAAIELGKQYTARELIDLIRARTFPPYAGSYFVHEGRKVYLRLELTYEEQQDKSCRDLQEVGRGSIH